MRSQGERLRQSGRGAAAARSRLGPFVPSSERSREGLAGAGGEFGGTRSCRSAPRLLRKNFKFPLALRSCFYAIKSSVFRECAYDVIQGLARRALSASALRLADVCAHPCDATEHPQGKEVEETSTSLDASRTCACRTLDSDIVMVQSADDRQR